jgi:uncharacterized OsmC-like protein
MTKPLKRWSVNAVSEGPTSLTLFCDDRPLGHALAAPENLSPIQYLLISIASCFALSCRAELGRRKLSSRIPFEVVVTGDKESGSGDNLLSRISIVAIFGSGITEPLAREITARAKPLCTVTNTLLDSPKIRFKSRALTQPRSVSRELPDRLAAH